MASTPSKSPNNPGNMASTQDFADASPKPRIASGTLPPQAAQAPEFIPGEAYQLAFLEQLDDDQEGDRKMSDVSSEREDAAEKKKKRPRRYKKHPRAEKEPDEEALRQQAMDEEWWSGDDVFVPYLRGREDVFWSDDQI